MPIFFSLANAGHCQSKLQAVKKTTSNKTKDSKNRKKIKSQGSKRLKVKLSKHRAKQQATKKAASDKAKHNINAGKAATHKAKRSRH